jgi:hypothetical protein
MFLEDTQIDLPYSCHAMTRSWLVHGFADQGARLYVGDTLAAHRLFSKLTITQIIRTLSRDHDLGTLLTAHFHLPFLAT